jgi:DNA-binding NarL/FixJ family response regulator
MMNRLASDENRETSIQQSNRPRSGELTPREEQIVELVRQAKLNKEIAGELSLAEGTVREYLSRLYRKLGVKNRTELAVWAISRQAIPA